MKKLVSRQGNQKATANFTVNPVGRLCKQKQAARNRIFLKHLPDQLPNCRYIKITNDNILLIIITWCNMRNS